jgi:hypothetical protein
MKLCCVKRLLKTRWNVLLLTKGNVRAQRFYWCGSYLTTFYQGCRYKWFVCQPIESRQLKYSNLFLKDSAQKTCNKKPITGTNQAQIKSLFRQPSMGLTRKYFNSGFKQYMHWSESRNTPYNWPWLPISGMVMNQKHQEKRDRNITRMQGNSFPHNLWITLWIVCEE